MELRFSSIDQANAVYDVVEHRVLTTSVDIDRLPSLEQDEVFELVAFLHRLNTLIERNEGK